MKRIRSAATVNCPGSEAHLRVFSVNFEKFFLVSVLGDRLSLGFGGESFAGLFDGFALLGDLSSGFALF